MRRWMWIALLAGAGLSGCNASVQAPQVSAPTASSALVARGNPADVTAVADTPFVRSILEQRDRTVEDRAQDAPRQTADLLTYLDVKPGMNVAELASGNGYFTELLARSVGSEGRLFAENPPSLLAKQGLASAWESRLARPAGARVVRIDDELGRPLPMHSIDLVLVSDALGDLAAEGAEPGATATAAWNALESGGRLVLMEPATPDHASDPTVEAVLRCGFQLASVGHFFHDGSRAVATFIKP